MRANITDEIYVPIKFNKKLSEYRAVLDTHGKARYYTSVEMVEKYCTEKYDDILVFRLAGFADDYNATMKGKSEK